MRMHVTAGFPRAALTSSGVSLPGGFLAPESQVAFVEGELERVKGALEELAGQRLGDEALAAGLKKAN